MTPLNMADSTKAENLPDGYDAYLAYVDGEWATADAVKAKFPHKPVVTLTVLGGDAVADGCDREPGDLSAATAVEWVATRLEAGADRPIVYASVLNMAPILSGLAGASIARHKVRLLAAHYLAGRHICGPASCGLMSVNADGTQWTDAARGNDGTRIDASLLLPDFFGPPSFPAWQEHMMQQLPEVREGATGEAVRTVQALCVARGHVIAVDGVFGPVTTAAVIAVQRAAKIADDGAVGPQTYPVLLGVALPAPPQSTGSPSLPGGGPFSSRKSCPAKGNP